MFLLKTQELTPPSGNSWIRPDCIALIFSSRMKIREDETFTDEIEKFRIMHQKRCKLVEGVDQTFKYYIANTYMTNVPLLCLLLYIIVYPDDEDIVFR